MSSLSEMMMGSMYEGMGKGMAEWVVMEGGDILFFKKLEEEVRCDDKAVEQIDL